MLIYICSSAIYPREIKAESSSEPGKEYKTIAPTLFNDAVCDCPGFHFRGTCKHISSIHICDWWESFDGKFDNVSKHCPKCGQPIELYETEAVDYGKESQD
jgi:hypothetical protein